jgi:hypothetical protein
MIRQAGRTGASGIGPWIALAHDKAKTAGKTIIVDTLTLAKRVR